MTALEVPVLTVTLYLLALLWQSGAPWSDQLPHIVSAVQTVLGLATTVLWVFFISPAYFGNAPIALQLGRVLANDKSTDM